MKHLASLLLIAHLMCYSGDTLVYDGYISGATFLSCGKILFIDAETGTYIPNDAERCTVEF